MARTYWQDHTGGLVFLLVTGSPDGDAVCNVATMAPVLTVERDRPPDATAKELARFRPDEVVRIGGEEALALWWLWDSAADRLADRIAARSTGNRAATVDGHSSLSLRESSAQDLPAAQRFPVVGFEAPVVPIGGGFALVAPTSPPVTTRT
jgi:hypothetical protein